MIDFCGPFVFDNLPPSGEKIGHYLIWLKKFPYRCLDRDERMTSKWTGKMAKIDCYFPLMYGGGYHSTPKTYDWYEIQYSKKIYRRAWIDVGQVVEGSGDIGKDNDRVNYLRRELYICDREMIEKILNGQIVSGMTRTLTIAALGFPLNRKIIPKMQCIKEVWEYPTVLISFIDGRLADWKVKK